MTGCFRRKYRIIYELLWIWVETAYDEKEVRTKFVYVSHYVIVLLYRYK
jgi:hypothetical protein